jgi:hypothetical protein
VFFWECAQHLSKRNQRHAGHHNGSSNNTKIKNFSSIEVQKYDTYVHGHFDYLPVHIRNNIEEDELEEKTVENVRHSNNRYSSGFFEFECKDNAT